MHSGGMHSELIMHAGHMHSSLMHSSLLLSGLMLSGLMLSGLMLSGFMHSGQMLSGLMHTRGICMHGTYAPGWCRYSCGLCTQLAYMSQAAQVPKGHMRWRSIYAQTGRRKSQ